MSMMICTGCDAEFDTDDDPEGLYVQDGQFWCRACREAGGWPPESDPDDE